MKSRFVIRGREKTSKEEMLPSALLHALLFFGLISTSVAYAKGQLCRQRVAINSLTSSIYEEKRSVLRLYVRRGKKVKTSIWLLFFLSMEFY